MQLELASVLVHHKNQAIPPVAQKGMGQGRCLSGIWCESGIFPANPWSYSGYHSSMWKATN